MTALRRPNTFFAAALFAFLVPSFASAATTEFRVLFDVDRNAGTGCNADGMPGVEHILVATVEVNETEAHVTQVHRRDCVAGNLGGSFTGPLDVDPSDYSAAGGTGEVIAEFKIAYAALADAPSKSGNMPVDMRLGFVGQGGSNLQTIFKAQGNQDIIFPDSTPGRRRAVNPGGSHVFFADGNKDDWGGFTPLAPGGAASGSNQLRIINVYGGGNGSHFFFRFDASVDPEDNEAPTNITLEPTTVSENEPAGTVVGSFSTDDPNAGDTHTYALVPGVGSTDNALFTITAGGNLLRTAVQFDFEAASSYSIRVETTDAGGLTFQKAFTIAITNANDTPTDTALSNDTVAENAPAGTTVGTFSSTDQDAGETFTYLLIGGTGSADNASFTIVGNELRTNAVLDYESQSSYSIRVRTMDSGGRTYDEVFTITSTNENEAPTALAVVPSSVDENQPAGTVVGTFSTTDPDFGDTFTYGLVAGAGSTDNASFTIVGNQLRTTASFDFETKNSYSIRVRTTDAGGLMFEQVLTITVDNVNEAPTDITLTGNTVAENQPAGTAVGTFSTTDEAGNTHTYTLVSGTGDTDNASFTIVGGVLQTAASFDFETKSSYSIRVRTTDGGGLFYEEAFTITVTNANDGPTDIALSNGNAPENQPVGTTIGTFSTTDQDAGDTFTYTLVSGTGSTDNASFQIVGNQLQNAVNLNYETNPVYSIRVRSTDAAGAFFDKVFTITLTNVNEAPTDITPSATSVSENQPAGTVVGTLSTTDPDVGDTHTYTLVAGAGDTDNASFAIVGNQLQTAAMFDFETKSSYTIRVRTTDAGGLFYEEQITITVTNLNDAPTDITLSANTVAENQPSGTVVGLFSTTDPDAGDTFTYTLVTGTGDTDNASFAIVGNQLQTAASFDFETKSSYSIRVRTTDAGGLFYEEAFTITVTNANDGPTDMALSNTTTPENSATGTVIGTFSTTDQDAGDTFTYTLVAGTGDADNASFQIAGNQLQNAVNLDFEAQPTYSIRVRTTDAGGQFYEEVFVITATNVNETPTDIALSGSTVAEDAAIGTVIGNLSTTDPDGVGTFTYTLVVGTGDTDNASFMISGNQLQLNTALNFETKSSYSVRIRTTDAGGLFYEEAFTITVTNVNEAPTDITLSANTVNENMASGTVVGTFSTTDADAGDTFTYTLVTGTGDGDNASFSIVGNQLQTAASFDFETKSSYSIRVRTTDAAGLFYEEQFTITINNVNDAPTDMALSNATVNENAATGTAVGNLSTTDQDAGDTFTYTLVSGTGDTGNASFQIVGNQLQTAAILNFEAQPSYSVRIRTTDAGGLFYEEAFTITVTNVNDAPTDMTLSNNSVNEELAAGAAVGNLSTDDQDLTDTFTYTLVAGTGDTGNASFAIVGNQLQTAATFDYETTTSYSVRIRTTDAGGLFYEEAFTINVNNVNDAPTDITLSANTIAENQPSGTAVGTFSTTDIDPGDTHTYTLVTGTGDADNASFSIVGNQLQTAASFDFETKSSYSIRVRTTDAGGLFYEEQFTITVTNANETPTDMALSNATVAENAATGTAVGNLSSTDVDAADTFTYTLVSGTGDTGNASFQIVGNQLQTAAILNFEAQPSYSVRIRTTDAGGLFYEEAFTITVTDANDAPTDMTLSNNSVNEELAAGAAVGNLSTTDQDPTDTFTYTLVAGTGDTGNASFQIVGNQLQTAATFDYETTTSYSVRIRTTDAGGLFYEEAFTINVNNVNDAPTDITLSGNTIAENQASGTAVGTFSTTDIDPGDTHTYTLVTGTGDADNASFSIVGNQLQTAASFDFETKSSYSIRVRTTDAGGLFYEEAFTITVTNANETPTDIALSNATVAENAASGTAVGNLSSTDVDAGDTFTYTLVSGTGDTGNASFQIVGNQLQTAAILNFEAQSSYSVRIRTTDAGGLFYEEAFTITVTDANDAPTDMTLSNNSVNEELAAGAAVGNLSTTDQDLTDTFTYTLVAGTGDTGNASFAIVGNQLQTAATFDYETTTSYSVRIRTTDAGGLFYEEAFTINVNNVNDAPTDITLSANTIAENQPSGTAVGTFSTTDIDPGDTHTYTLVTGTGDADNASFSIVGNQLQTAASFDFETKSSYSIRVRTTDAGGLFYEEQFTITVTNANETPTDMALSNATAAENEAAGTPIGTFSTTDPDAGDTFTYTLVTGTGDTDNASFQIVGNQLQNATILNFEAKSIYTIRVRTTDAGGLFYEEAFTITITDANDAPTALGLTPQSVNENMASGTTVGTFSTTDQEAQTYTYTLVAGAGDTDNASFTISGDQLQTAAVFNFEAKSSYAIRVRTTDSGTPNLFFEQTFTITVNNVNEAPTVLNLSAASIPENQPSGTAVGTFSTTDPDTADTFTYTLVTGTGDADNASFTIVGNQLQTTASFDFETDNSYSIRVRTTDAGGLFIEQQFTITVTNVNETPTDITLSANSINENNAINATIGTLSTTDVDAGDTFTYTLVAGAGDTDNASFNILGNALRASIAFNFEVKSSYTVRIRTTDAGGLFYEEAFTITVNDLNEAPVADDDPYTRIIGNTQHRVDGGAGVVSGVAFHSHAADTNPLVGDVDPDTNPAFNTLSIVAVTDVATANGGRITIDADGSFTYTPPPGVSGATADFYDYTLTDGTNTDTGRLNFTINKMVWYVKNDATAPFRGTSTSPFAELSDAAIDALADDAEDASAADSTIYVFRGTGTTTGMNSGIALKHNQHLLGETQSLVIDIDDAGAEPPVTLVTGNGANRPVIGNPAGSAVTVPATTNRTVSVKGFSISANDNAIDATTSAAAILDMVIDDIIITSATNEGIDINGGSTGASVVALSNITATASGNAIDVRRTAGTLRVSSFNNITVSGNSAAAGVFFDTVTFDTDSVTAGFQTVSGGTTAIGASGNPVGTSGMTLSNVTGDLAFTDLDIYNSSGSGFTLVGTGPVNTGAGTGTRVTVGSGVAVFNSTAGPAVDVNNATIDLQLSGLQSTSTSTRGVSLVSVSDGTTSARFSAPSGSSITSTAGATGPLFNVDGGNAAITFGGTITNSGTGRAILINNWSGDDNLTDDMAFSGAIVENGAGILLNGNSGVCAISFTGGLTISTSTGEGFGATSNTNSDGLHITGTNTINSTSATALRVTNTTIGSSHITFRSVSSGNNTAAADPASGVVIDSTGGVGSLRVQGTGVANSGGTIQNTTSHAISLTNTLHPQFAWMNVQNAGRSGVDGQQVTNFTFTDSTINNVGTAAAGQFEESGIAFNDGGAMTSIALSGTATISNNTITNARRHGIEIQNGSGTLSNLTIQTNTITSSTSAANSLGHGIIVNAGGSVATTAHVTTATLNNNVINNIPSGSGIFVGGGSGNTSNNTSAVLGANGTPFAITNNRIAGTAGSKMGQNAIIVTFNGMNGVSNFNISNNGTLANPLAHFQGIGISVFFGGSVTGTTTVNNNIVASQQTIAAGSAGIAVQADDGPAGLGTSAANVNVTINGNNVSLNEGNGIRAIARASSAVMDLTIQNNTVTAPTLTNRNGIRVDSGSATGDTALCLLMTGNTSDGSGVNAGIGIRKQGTIAATNDFGIVGLAPSPTTAANAGAKVAADNPAGGGVDVLSGDNFTSCTQTP